MYLAGFSCLFALGILIIISAGLDLGQVYVLKNLRCKCLNFRAVFFSFGFRAGLCILLLLYVSCTPLVFLSHVLKLYGGDPECCCFTLV